MGFSPQWLTGLQIGLESGGKQIDPKTGLPITSPKGAVGIAQVMPGTGPEAAAAAGLPWDPVRYKTDRDYNLQIGDAYQGKLNNTYFPGNRLAATAAYNAGPTAVKKLIDKHGNDWAAHLPPETKKYVKHVLGVNVAGGDSPNAYYPGNSAGGLLDSTANALGVPLKEYSVGKPGSNESSSVQATAPQVDNAAIQSKAQDAVTTSDMYTTYLKSVTAPIVQNMTQQIDRQQKITGIKRNIVNDFATREADLETKIKPLMQQREQIAQQLLHVNEMNPLEQRFKAIFNPNQYDPRMLRGQLERVESAMGIYENNYEELNKLRSGVAAASVDAESADQQTLELGRQSTAVQMQLLGQVSGAVKQNLGDQLYPLQTHVDTLKLQEATKQSLLGKLTLEKTVSLFQQAQASPDGSVTVDGVKLTVGELQDAARVAQGQDLTFKNMVNAFKSSDMNTADAMESNYIDHMTKEQLDEAMKNQGKITGTDGTTYQLSMSRLAQAYAASDAMRERSVDEVVKNTAIGLAGSTVNQLGSEVQGAGQRAKEMFGNLPGAYSGFLNNFTAQIHAWTDGLNQANAAGIGKDYIAKNIGVLNDLHKQYDTTVSSIADSWAGGKAELKAVADNYLRGNPLSGDAAVKGLLVMARSGIPSGTQLSGPAAQAYQVARATVQEWDNPQAGDSADMLKKALQGQSHKESDLQRLVQQRVQSVYADAMADSVMKDLPQLARSVRDPNNPGKLHPFARVSQEDFIMSVRHGDAQAYQVIGTKLGVDAQTAKRIFSSGPDSPEWQAVASKKGLSKGSFDQYYQSLQALQMSETLSALDASHSAAPGFSPSKAYVDFLGTPEVANRVGQAVQNYGNSGFGPYIISSSAGGGFRDSWDGYVQSVGAVYQQTHGRELQQRIQEMRSTVGDPWTRLNAVNRAAGLTPQESQALMQAVKPLSTINDANQAELLGTRNPALIREVGQRNFDSISTIMRTHKFDDPVIESLRKKVAGQWDTMDSLVRTVLDSTGD